MKRSYEFNAVIARVPGDSVVNGLRAGPVGMIKPDPALFRRQHSCYLEVLRRSGVRVTLLDALEDYPDSVFVEDAALCIGDTAIALRPGAASRAGETPAIRSALDASFERVIELPGHGTVEGGDILLTESEAFVGLSSRTDQQGFDALAEVLSGLGYITRKVNMPPSILHFKTACGLLDETTVFATAALHSTGCFDGYRIVEAIPGEEAAANLVRVNNVVLCSTGYPRTAALLMDAGYEVVQVDISQAAKIDGGLSCLSVRFHTGFTPSV